MPEIIIDLHTHSKYAQATSKNLDLAHMEAGCRQKGIHVFGTGDFTHPLWQKELATLQESNGLGFSRTGFPFMFTTEISLIYKDKGKVHKTHNLVLAPSLDVVHQITEWLLTKGRVDYDGRPIFKISCPEFVESLRSISPDVEVIPAHIWTPWFSLFGSNSGWDRLSDCFEDQTKHIHAVETGLSSDPAMNWRLSQLDNVNIVSFSDAHSPHPWRIGREATAIHVKELSYANVLKQLRSPSGIARTFEVDPNYGKYHYDGHRACNVRLTPQQTMQNNGLCPVCKKPVTRGVLGRVEELADRPVGSKRTHAAPFESFLPLHEILSLVHKKALATKTVQAAYDKLVQNTTEYFVVREMPMQDLVAKSNAATAQAILAMRQGKVEVQAGYDGVYGTPVIPGILEDRQDALYLGQRKLGEYT
jgi:uncharacterized protein (TIGR00375 family)